MSDARTTDERYSQAVKSSDLSTGDDNIDVNYLIAAGKISETLGVKLYRLAAEWDMAAGDYKLAMQHVRSCEFRALRAMRAARRSPAGSDKLLAESAAMTASARGQAETARILAMGYLKSLHGTADAVHRFAQRFAITKRWNQKPEIVESIAGKALKVWLDGACSACSGRSFNGGYTSPVLLCTSCGATGRALWALDKQDVYAPRIRALLVEMDAMASRAEGQIRAMVRKR